MSPVKTLLMFVLWTALVLGVGISKGREYEQGVVAQAHLREVQRIEKERDDVQAKLNETATQWVKDKARIPSTASGIVDRLAESDVRLRVKLADATVAEVQGYNRGRADGTAEIHRETAEALIAITAEADATVSALQAVVKEVTHGQAGQ